MRGWGGVRRLIVAAVLAGVALLALAGVSPAPVRAAGGPDLGITITDNVNHQSSPGGSYTYTYTVTNAAGADPITAGNAITMTIPISLTFSVINIPGSAGWTENLAFVGGDVVLTVRYVGAYPVAAGQTLPPYNIPVQPPTGGPSVTTSASVSTPGDTNPANDSTRHVVYLQAAPCVVNTTADPADSDKRTLRDAVAAANLGRCTGDTITFDPAVFGTAQTITLVAAQGPLTLSRSVTITGPGTNLLTLDGGCTDCAPGTVPNGGPTTGTKVFLINAGGTYAISGMTLQHGNGGTSGSGSGGAVDVLTGTNTVTLSGLVLRENAAPSGGAISTGVGGSATTLAITDSEIAGNTASAGGGIYVSSGVAATLTNVTISGNSGPGGSGGALFSNVAVTITNATITGNTGGFRVLNAGTKTLTRSIVAGNSGGDVTGTLAATSANNLIGDGSGGLTNGTNGNIIGTSGSPINPLLAPLGDYGGPTRTRPPLPGSPAIDAGGAGCSATDQRGLSRPVNTNCDIGAVESRGFTLSVAGGNNQSANVNAAFSNLAVMVAGNAIPNSGGLTEPIANGQVTFTPPVMGASAAITGSPAAINGSMGLAIVAASANGTAGGPYTVVASASGATSVSFSLTNNALACVVTTSADSGAGSLREKVGIANAGGCTGDTITFDPAVFNVARTITLTAASGPLTLTRGVTITGPGANLLTVDGGCTTCAPGGMRMDGDGTKVFLIAGPGTYGISGMTVQHGNGGGGGGANVGGAVEAFIASGMANTVTLSGVVLRENASPFLGGAVAIGGGGGTTALAITGSTIADNTANGPFGGGISVAIGNSLTLASVTVTGNTVTGVLGGGGVFNGGTAATLTDVTIVGNAAPGGAGGGFRGNATVARTIIAGNANGDVSGTLTDGGNNLIGDGSGGLMNGINGNIVGTSGSPINPLLAALGAYGGATTTRPPLPGSPAIDAGGAGCTGNDQRGLPRPLAGTNCDIGAVESRGFAFSAPTGGGQSALVGTAFMAPLGVTVTGNVVSGIIREPVDGGVIAFAGPTMAGTASIVPNPTAATIPTGGAIGDGIATATVTANGTAGGPYTVTASASGTTGSASYSLTDTAPMIAVNPATVPGGTVGTPYPAQMLAATGNGTAPYTFAVATGSTLPPGLTLAGNSFGGTPTMAGMFTFTLTATDANLFTGSRMFTVTIQPAVIVNPATLLNGTAGVAYSQMITATGGTGSGYTFAVVPAMGEQLPPGLMLNGTTGAITGTPTMAGMFTFTVRATDSGMNSGTKQYAVTVLLAVAVSPPSLPGGTVGTAYSQMITATGGTGTGYTFAVVPTMGEQLPPGLALATNGTLSGTPTMQGTFAFTVRATDSGMNSGTRQYAVTVGAATLTGVTVARTSGGTVTGGVVNVPAGGTVQLALTAAFSDGSMQPATGGVMWASGDPAKATVDGTGKVTGLSPGTVTITASYMGQTATFTLVITAPGTGGLMPNPAPMARPDAATAPASAPTTPPLPAPPTRAAAAGNTGGGIGPQGGGTATPTPRPAPPMR